VKIGVFRAKNSRGKPFGVTTNMDNGFGSLLGALEVLKEEFPEGLWSSEGEFALVNTRNRENP
jgi:hypothetical protein